MVLTEQRILEALRNAERPLSKAELADTLSVKFDSLSTYLFRMNLADSISRTKSGKYKVFIKK